MSNYYLFSDGSYHSEDELQHYGVPGMRWGHRKNRYAGVSTNGSKKAAYEKAVQQMKTAKAAKKTAAKTYSKAYNKADARGLAAFSPVKKQREANAKRWDDAFKAGQDYHKAAAKYGAAKKAAKAAKKAAKIEAKAVKEKYRKEYMKGESTVGKIYSKLTGDDKIAADLAYSENKGRYNKNWNR